MGTKVGTKGICPYPCQPAMGPWRWLWKGSSVPVEGCTGSRGGICMPGGRGQGLGVQGVSLLGGWRPAPAEGASLHACRGCSTQWHGEALVSGISPGSPACAPGAALLLPSLPAPDLLCPPRQGHSTPASAYFTGMLRGLARAGEGPGAAAGVGRLSTGGSARRQPWGRASSPGGSKRRGLEEPARSRFIQPGYGAVGTAGRLWAKPAEIWLGGGGG